MGTIRIQFEPTRLMYALNAHTPDKLLDVAADLANFLLILGPFAWLGPLPHLRCSSPNHGGDPRICDFQPQAEIRVRNILVRFADKSLGLWENRPKHSSVPGIKVMQMQGHPIALYTPLCAMLTVFCHFIRCVLEHTIPGF